LNGRRNFYVPTIGRVCCNLTSYFVVVPEWVCEVTPLAASGKPLPGAVAELLRLGSVDWAFDAPLFLAPCDATPAQAWALTAAGAVATMWMLFAGLLFARLPCRRMWEEAETAVAAAVARQRRQRVCARQSRRLRASRRA
jgi:hypothetical protein